MSDVDVIRNSILTACERASQAIDEMEANGPGIIRQGAEWIVKRAGIPPILDKIAEDQIVRIFTEQLQNFVSFARNTVMVMRFVADNMGSPDALRAAATTLGGIGTNASTLNEEVSKEYLLAADPSNWSENYQYSVAIDKQPDAVARVATYTDGMSGALDAMANAIESFYGEAAGIILGGAGAYIGLVGAVVGVALCFTGAGAIVGLPMAIVSALGALVSAAGAMVSVYNMITGTMQNINEQIGALEGSVIDDSGADSWHQPVLG
ncbi:hypothetical protein GCM10027413_32040 [Conyzicola nivalis]|uniref:Uncharacterized protein n=1 Tax=Conyzicola nivalis TaxID=1477021 RepID=A0A916SPM1_9MICO|nr:hypothetical protein [Conyzicola nivalis]GGB11655.1 hypothetical protein GCM10010979_27470 [Conyzicola nivalis]